MLGPSASSAKARVLFAVDGLEVKIWGLREDVEEGEGVVEESDASSSEEEEDEEEEEYSDVDSTEESESESSNECDSILESSTDLEATSSGSSDDSIIDEQPSSPPQSRSPSPVSFPSSSRSQSPLPDAPTPKPIAVPRPPPPPQTPSYASEQDALRSAELLLSRTLANACAEEDGLGMACELGLSFLSPYHPTSLIGPQNF